LKEEEEGNDGTDKIWERNAEERRKEKKYKRNIGK
jgi:hypothetical protein